MMAPRNDPPQPWCGDLFSRYFSYTSHYAVCSWADCFAGDDSNLSTEAAPAPRMINNTVAASTSR